MTCVPIKRAFWETNTHRERTAGRDEARGAVDTSNKPRGAKDGQEINPQALGERNGTDVPHSPQKEPTLLMP